MKRLIERGLMFANLFEVATPVLVARYNTALEKLTGRRTALERFHVDLSGYAPEIGDELGDPLYLNPDGANRQFILLSPEQRRAPLLNAAFSSSQSILRAFIADNRDALFALTARDAVLGELENSAWRLRAPADLMEIRTVRIAANTLSGILAGTERLRGLIAEFETSPDAWADDAFVGEMISLARRVGDIRVQKYQLARLSYPLGNFHTTHFGGLWVFRSAALPAVLHAGEAPAGISGASVVSAGDAGTVMAFLEQNNLVEPIETAAGLDGPALLRERMDFMLMDRLAATDVAGIADLGPAELRALRNRHLSELPPTHRSLAEVLHRMEQGVARPPLDPRDPGCFYRLRARPGPDRILVNHLLAALTPLDPRQLFICNKTAFYAAYRQWPDAKKDWVAELLARDYLPDKPGRRAALYGYDEDEGGAPAPAPANPWARGRAAQ